MSLKDEYNILHLVFHRNKNQHSSAKWWKHHSILHRHLRKLIIHQDAGDTELSTAEALYIRKLIPSCYRAYYSVLELGQFITLGMTLLALLARISHLVSKIDGVEKRQTKVNQSFVSSRNDDLGQVVEMPVHDSTPDVPTPVKEPPKKKRKTSKKSKKSSIDDIFG